MSPYQLNVKASQVQQEIARKVESLNSVADNIVCDHWDTKQLIIGQTHACELLAGQIVQSSTQRRVSSVQNQQLGIVVKVYVLNS